MFTITIDPIIFSVGNFALHWYGLILMVAMIIGIWLTAREASGKGFKKEDIYDAAVWIVIGGIIGARFFHVLDQWSAEFASNPIRVFYIWEGGLAIWGAVTGGLITTAFISWKRGWHLLALLDSAAPGLVLAQAIGRVACIITGDAVGKPTNGPFGLAYTSPNAIVQQLGVFYTPMPVYEIIANLLIFTLLWNLRKRLWPDGRLFLVYMLLYSLERFFLAFTSAYRIVAFGLTQSQIVALIAMTISLAVLAFMPRKLSKQTI